VTSPARYRPTAPEAGTRIDLASQATAIEQSRAIAEVQAAVLVAQQNPRNKNIAVAEMRDACAQTAVAEKAYYRYNRGDGMVTGVSIHLARELARCWGNIDYGIKELRRDDAKGESEMLAHAWDLQVNSRISTTFIVPHVRDLSGGGSRKLTATRDIYENNANAGARRVREQILAVLPNWFVEEAKANCDATLKNGDGRTSLDDRITNAVRGFAGLGVTVEQLEAKTGAKRAEWTGEIVGQLAVIYNSIKRGESHKADEFPPAAPATEGVSAEEITRAGRTNRTADDPGEKAAPEEKPTRSRSRRARPEPETAPPAITSEQLDEVAALFEELGLSDENENRDFVRKMFNRDELELTALTEEEGQYLLSQLREVLAGPPAEENGADQ